MKDVNLIITNYSSAVQIICQLWQSFRYVNERLTKTSQVSKTCEVWITTYSMSLS